MVHLFSIVTTLLVLTGALYIIGSMLRGHADAIVAALAGTSAYAVARPVATTRVRMPVRTSAVRSPMRLHAAA